MYSFLKKAALILSITLIISPVFFFQSKTILAKEEKGNDNTYDNQKQITSSSLLYKLTQKIYCSITSLFSDNCALQGTTSVTNPKAIPPIIIRETPLQTPVPQPLISYVSSPVTTVVGITSQYLEQRLMELKQELTLTQTPFVYKTYTNKQSNISSKQVDHIYDDMGENDSDIEALIPNLSGGTSGYVLQSDGTNFLWVSTSTLGMVSGGSSDLDALDPIEIGNSNTVSGLSSSAVGYGNTVSGDLSLAFGVNNVASSTATLNLEYGAVAIGFGNDSTSSGIYGAGSSAIGINNTTSGNHSTASGYQNTTSGIFSVGVGADNVASDRFAAAFGNSNIASGEYSLVVGFSNEASGRLSSIFGSDITNDIDTSVMIGPSDSAKLTITLTGAIGIRGTTTPSNEGAALLDSSGAKLTEGGTWTNASSRDLKENFTDLDKEDLLKKISQLNIQSWNYKTENDSITHIGPIAQQFYELFGLGGSDTSISTIDPAGLALVGVQVITDKLSKFANFIETKLLKAERIDTDSINTKEICVGETCITETEFLDLLERNNIDPSVDPIVNPAEDPLEEETNENSTTNPVIIGEVTPAIEETPVEEVVDEPTVIEEEQKEDPEEVPVESSDESVESIPVE